MDKAIWVSEKNLKRVALQVNYSIRVWTSKEGEAGLRWESGVQIKQTHEKLRWKFPWGKKIRCYNNRRRAKRGKNPSEINVWCNDVQRNKPVFTQKGSLPLWFIRRYYIHLGTCCARTMEQSDLVPPEIILHGDVITILSCTHVILCYFTLQTTRWKWMGCTSNWRL